MKEMPQSLLGNVAHYVTYFLSLLGCLVCGFVLFFLIIIIFVRLFLITIK